MDSGKIPGGILAPSPAVEYGGNVSSIREYTPRLPKSLQTLIPTTIIDSSGGCQLNWSPRNQWLSLIFLFIFCISIVGNGLVIVTIVQQRWMRTVTNLYLLNLAMADLLLVVICMPPSLLALLYECFFFGGPLCRIIAFLQSVAVTASAYTLAVIAMERYYAICKPLRSRLWQTRRHVVKMITASWLLAFLTNAQVLYTSELIEHRRGRFNCNKGDWMSPGLKLVEVLFMCLTHFLLPLLVMLWLYGMVIHHLRIGIQLEKRKSAEEVLIPQNHQEGEEEVSMKTRFRRAMSLPFRDGALSFDKDTSPPLTPPPTAVERTKSSAPKVIISPANSPKNATKYDPSDFTLLRSTHSERSLSDRKRVIKMLLTVVLTFTISWVPLYVNTITQRWIETRGDRPTYRYNAYVWVISYLSTCTNPLVYCFLNRKFRAAFLLAFGCSTLVKNRYGLHFYHANVQQIAVPGNGPGGVDARVSSYGGSQRNSLLPPHPRYYCEAAPRSGATSQWKSNGRSQSCTITAKNGFLGPPRPPAIIGDNNNEFSTN